MQWVTNIRFVLTERHPRCQTPNPGVSAEWTAIDSEPTGALSFGGGGDATLLNQLLAMTQAGQLSNIAAYVPSDCPTREKHAWLGDALDVAEEMMYNFWAPPMCVNHPPRTGARGADL